MPFVTNGVRDKNKRSFEEGAHMETNSTSVLVVGGSLVGLSAAVFLGWRGVPTVLVETHTGSHPHPRAIGYTPRTMELFRTVGLGPLIPQAPRGFRLRRCKIESLAGKWFEESDWTPPKAGRAREAAGAARPKTPPAPARRSLRTVSSRSSATRPGRSAPTFVSAPSSFASSRTPTA